jgi:hypothetical protein
MLKEPLPNVACSHTDDGVLARIIGRGAAKHDRTEDSFLKGFGMPGERLIHYMCQKLTASMTSFEGGTIENLAEMKLKAL